MPKIRNIIIFIAIGAVLVLIYIFFIKPKPPVDALISSPSNPVAQNTLAPANDSSSVTQDFLSLLSNIKSIKLDDTIFSDDAFISLHDSSIILIQDGKEGRINPFASLGNEVTATPPPSLTCTLPKVLDVPTNTCITPPPTCTLPKVLDVSTNTCVNSH